MKNGERRAAVYEGIRQSDKTVEAFHKAMICEEARKPGTLSQARGLRKSFCNCPYQAKVMLVFLAVASATLTVVGLQ
jgi:hypothetical protein